MMRLTRRIPISAVAVAVVVAFCTTALAEETTGPWENLKTSPVKVSWQYSNDGGKTFSDTVLPGPPPGQDPRRKGIPVYPYAWKGTFEISDPAQVAGLWVRLFEDPADEKTGPRAAICNGNIWDASGGWWKDLGFCPTLLDTVITLNGKPMPIALGPVLQFWVPLVGEIKKGTNTIELRGNVYTYWLGSPAKALDAKIISAEPQETEICNGPVLGDWGEDYFTVACRTQMPAEVTVDAAPVEPAGEAVKAVSTGAVWHRLKLSVPAGTRTFTYSVSVKVGSHVTKSGPYSVTLPGKEYRFVAYGGAMQQPLGGELWKHQSQFILKQTRPDFVVNTGNFMEQETWSFHAQKAWTEPGAELLARVPRFVTPCNHDFSGLFNELFYTPAPDGYGHSWSKVVGPVRFIGIDGNAPWPAGGQNARWLEEVLAAAKEKFIVVLSGYPAYTSGINSKRMFGGRKQVRDVVMPLLGKYRATVMLSSWDPDYERIEPTPDKGCTQIVTGCIGQKSWHKWDSRFGSHPFGPPNGNPRGTVGKVVAPDGREWVGYFGRRNVCIFTATSDSLTMKVYMLDMPAKDAATTGDTRKLKEMTVLDEKTFKARN